MQVGAAQLVCCRTLSAHGRAASTSTCGGGYAAPRAGHMGAAAIRSVGQGWAMQERSERQRAAASGHPALTSHVCPDGLLHGALRDQLLFIGELQPPHNHQYVAAGRQRGMGEGRVG